MLGWLFAFAVALAALLPGAAWAQDQITITAPELSVPESTSTQTGSFDVSIAASGSSLPEVSDFNVNLQLSGGGVQFTGGTATTDIPYIFAGQTSGPTVPPPTGGGTMIDATDYASSPPTLVNGDGLVSVDYSVPANTSGTFAITFITSNSSGSATALDNQYAQAIPFTVQNGTLTVVPSTVYWYGNTDSNWNTLSGSNYITNWSTSSTGFTDAHALPGATTDVYFNGHGSNLNTTLGANLSIKGLTFTSAATSPVSISGDTLSIGADGLNLNTGAAAITINSGVMLSASQTWAIASSNPLTLGGTLSLAGQTLTKTGSGTVRITAAPSLASGSVLAVTAGTVQLDVSSGTASVGSNATATVAAAATLQLAGSVSALSDGSAIDPADGNLVNITNDGSTASGGGLLVTGTNQSVGVVSGASTTTGGATTYTGDTVVGNGSTGASLTVSQVLQNSLSINAGSTVTIRPSGSAANQGAAIASSSTAVAATSDAAIVAAVSPTVAATVLSNAASPASGSTNAGNASAVSPAPASAASAAISTMPSIAAAPATPAGDPFLSIQNVISSGGNPPNVPARVANLVATAALPSDAVSPDSGPPVAMLATSTPVDALEARPSSSLATISAGDLVLPSSLVALGNSLTATAGGNAWSSVAWMEAGGAGSQFQNEANLTFSATPLGGIATFALGLPAIGGGNPVPEPSTLVLLLPWVAALVALAARRRRKASAPAIAGAPGS